LALSLPAALQSVLALAPVISLILARENVLADDPRMAVMMMMMVIMQGAFLT
jgi:hypothetical protein